MNDNEVLYVLNEYFDIMKADSGKALMGMGLLG